MSDEQYVLNGNTYPDELTATAAEHPNLPPELKKVFITPPEASGKAADALKPSRSTIVPLQENITPEPSVYNDFTQSPNIEDRRDEPNPNAVEWKNVLPSLKALAIGVGNQIWGIPENPIPGSEERSYLSDALGRGDMKIDPNTGRSLLERAIDDVQLGANQLGLGRGESWADKLTNPTGFSAGTKLGNAAATVLSNKLYGAVKAPVETAGYIKDMMDGKYPEWMVDPNTGEVHTNVQNIEKINDLAGMMVFGPAPVASKMAEGTLGSFMGVKSKSFNRDALQTAQEMAANGAHPDDIWKATRTFQGADGRWKQEIPTQNVNILDKGTVRITGRPDKMDWSGDFGSPDTIGIKPKYADLPANPTLADISKYLSSKGNDIRLEHVMDFPEIYDAYPFLKDLKIHPMPADLPYQGMVRGNEIFIRNLPPEEFTSTLLHELQHIIQRHEGFATGGNAGLFLPPDFANMKSRFASLKEDAINQSARDLGTVPDIVEKFKNIIKGGESGAFPIRKAEQDYLDKIKSRNPDTYNRLLNVAKSEILIKEAEDQAFGKYERIMGEVEARMVQARMYMNNLNRLLESPRVTEHRLVPREQQINPMDFMVNRRK